MPQDCFITAIIGHSFGLKGYVKIKSLSGEIDHILKLRKVRLQKDGEEYIYEIEDFLRQKNTLFVKFLGVDSPEEAKKICGANILVERAAAAPLLENEYYVEDLKKLDVLDRTDKTIGKVLDVIEAGGAFLLEICLANSKICLVPFKNEFFGDIDWNKRAILLLCEWILE